MRQIVDGICAAHDVAGRVRYETGFPPTINDAAAVAAVASAAQGLFGAGVDAACAPKLFSEDFAHMAAARPGCFLLLGNGCEDANARPLHSADYDFNDAALVPGSAFWVALTEQVLARGAA